MTKDAYPIKQRDTRHAAFLIPPTTGAALLKERMIQRYPFLKPVPEVVIERYIAPNIPIRKLHAGHLDGVVSKLPGPQGASQVNTEFRGIPFTPRVMIERHEQANLFIARTILDAERHGAEVVGLGGHTSIVGKLGKGQDQVKAARQIGATIPITTGNSLTAGVGVEALIEYAQHVGYENPLEETIGIIGATGSIGSACAELLLGLGAKRLMLCTGNNASRIERLNERINPSKYRLASREQVCREARLIITVTSETAVSDIDPSWFLPGAIICDIARPRNMSTQVGLLRPDVLVFDGGVMSVPGAEFVDQTVDVLMPKGVFPACTIETLLLALIGVERDWSIGELEVCTIRYLLNQADKHGFKLAGIRSNDQLIDERRLDPVREAVFDREMIL